MGFKFSVCCSFSSDTLAACSHSLEVLNFSLWTREHVCSVAVNHRVLVNILWILFPLVGQPVKYPFKYLKKKRKKDVKQNMVL